MEVCNNINSISTQFKPTETAPAASGWKPGKIAGQVAGRIGSIFGFKASVASPEQQQGRIAQNSAEQEKIVGQLAKINKRLDNLPGLEQEALESPGRRQPEYIKAQFAGQRTSLQKEGEGLATQLLQMIKGESPSKSAPARSSSPVTVSRPPSPATGSQAALEQYQKDKKQIAANEGLMNQPGGINSAVNKSRIAQDTWKRQQKVEEYEQKHPEVLQNNS